MEESPLITFGIMCEGNTLSKWQAKCVENLLVLGNVKLKLIIRDAEVGQESRSEKFKRINFNRLLFLLYSKTLFKPASNVPEDMTPIYNGVDQMACKTIKKGKYSQYFAAEDIATIKSYNLDFILRFGFNIIRGEILKVPRYGVWSFHHDDEMKYRGSPPCFYEIYNNDPVTGAILQRLTDRLDGGIILKKGFFKTNNTSYAKNLSQVYFESAYWPAEVCKDILKNNASYFIAPPSKSLAPIFYPPNNLRFVLFLLILVKNIIKKAYSRLFLFESWNVGVVEQPISHFLANDFRPQASFLKLSEKSKFIADPFGIENGDELHLFFEQFDYRTAKGTISRVKYTKRENQGKILPNLEISTHLSYPFVFKEGENIYCIPESSAAKEVSLYKAIDFPNAWEKASVLLPNIAAVDPTLIKYDGKYWLFYTLKERNCDLNLYISYADNLIGPWLSHAGNPVKTDIRSSRPAGTFFTYQDNLYRPAQNCSKTYGGSIIINKIIKLNINEFEEMEAVHLLPFDKYYKDGFHTIAALNDDITVIDSKRYEFNWAAFKTKFLSL